MTYQQKYPHVPGHRGGDTSIEAAAGIAPSLGGLQAAVHAAIIVAGSQGLTTNEIAANLNVDRGSVQPRTSELRAKGKIIDSGRRRLNANGKKAIVWLAVREVADVRNAS